MTSPWKTVPVELPELPPLPCPDGGFDEYGTPIHLEPQIKAYARAYARAALAAAPQQGWQPIETAPVDGTEFLGYRNGMFANAHRVPRDDCEMWVFGSVSAAVEVMPEIRPTHWQPKPPPPEE